MFYVDLQESEGISASDTETYVLSVSNQCGRVSSAVTSWSIMCHFFASGKTGRL